MLGCISCAVRRSSSDVQPSFCASSILCHVNCEPRWTPSHKAPMMNWSETLTQGVRFPINGPDRGRLSAPIHAPKRVVREEIACVPSSRRHHCWTATSAMASYGSNSLCQTGRPLNSMLRFSSVQNAVMSSHTGWFTIPIPHTPEAICRPSRQVSIFHSEVCVATSSLALRVECTVVTTTGLCSRTIG